MNNQGHQFHVYALKLGTKLCFLNDAPLAIKEEITRALGIRCQELWMNTKYIFCVIP